MANNADLLSQAIARLGEQDENGNDELGSGWPWNGASIS